RQTFAQFQSPELTAVIVEQCSPVENQDGVRMPPRRGIHQQLPGHSQMHGERSASIQLNFDELSMPLYAAYFSARQCRGRGIGVATQYAQARKFGAHDPP